MPLKCGTAKGRKIKPKKMESSRFEPPLPSAGWLPPIPARVSIAPPPRPRPRSQLSRSCLRSFCRSSAPPAFRPALPLPGIYLPALSVRSLLRCFGTAPSAEPEAGVAGRFWEAWRFGDDIEPPGHFPLTDHRGNRYMFPRQSPSPIR